MKRIQILWLAVAAMLVIGCGEKKKSDDIIAPKAEQPKLQAPIKMQVYSQTTDVKWLDKNYQVEIRRVPDDSLKMVKDETGQKFVDNRIYLIIMRADGWCSTRWKGLTSFLPPVFVIRRPTSIFRWWCRSAVRERWASVVIPIWIPMATGVPLVIIPTTKTRYDRGTYEIYI